MRFITDKNKNFESKLYFFTLHFVTNSQNFSFAYKKREVKNKYYGYY